MRIVRAIVKYQRYFIVIVLQPTIPRSSHFLCHKSLGPNRELDHVDTASNGSLVDNVMLLRTVISSLNMSLVYVYSNRNESVFGVLAGTKKLTSIDNVKC